MITMLKQIKIYLCYLIISVIDCNSKINKSQADNYNAEINNLVFMKLSEVELLKPSFRLFCEFYVSIPR